MRDEPAAGLWGIAASVGVDGRCLREVQALADLHLSHWLWALEVLVEGRAYDRHALAQLLAEHDDASLVREAGGAAALVELWLRVLTRYFVPEAARGAHAVARYVIETPDAVVSREVVVRDCRCTVVARCEDEPRRWVHRRQLPKSQPSPAWYCFMMFLAIRILWTSSGPSARRSVRAPWYIPASGRSPETPAAPHT